MRFLLEVVKKYEVSVEADSHEELERAAMEAAENGEIDHEWGGESWEISAWQVPNQLVENNPDCGLTIDGEILAYEDYLKQKGE